MEGFGYLVENIVSKRSSNFFSNKTQGNSIQFVSNKIAKRIFVLIFIAVPQKSFKIFCTTIPAL
jgi:hypothetical protein